MDTGTLTAMRATPAERLDGELLWWINGEGRLFVGGERVGTGGRGGFAAGRVCPASGIGVIETVGTRAAVLGLLPRGVVDLLGQRFPGVRWAIADVLPTATERADPRPR